VAIHPQRRSQNESVTTIILGAGWQKAIAKSIKLLGIDGIDGQATVHQCRDHRPMRHFKGNNDIGRVRGLCT
jgi:hypothetical protein